MMDDAIVSSKGDGRESSAVPKNLQIEELNELSSMLAGTIKEMARTLKNNRKTSVVDKSQILNRLMKSYSDLVKTHRAINGLDQAGSGNVSLGVIIIPGKVPGDDWVQTAHRELDNAKKLLAPLTSTETSTEEMAKK